MKHPKAVQALVLLDLKRAFQPVGVHYSPDDLKQIARKRGGGQREVKVAIRRIRDSGTEIVYSAEKQTYSHQVDADVIAARRAQKIIWQSLSMWQRETRALRGEYERNPTDLDLKRGLADLEVLCMELARHVPMTAAEALAPTQVVA